MLCSKGGHDVGEVYVGELNIGKVDIEKVML